VALILTTLRVFKGHSHLVREDVILLIMAESLKRKRDDEPKPEFPRFTELPAEIRHLIWEIASKKPRLVHLDNNTNPWQTQISNKHILNALDTVNKESRTIFRKHTQLHDIGYLDALTYRSASKAQDAFYMADHDPFQTKGMELSTHAVVDQRFLKQKLEPPFVMTDNRYDEELQMLILWYTYKRITVVMNGRGELPVETSYEDLQFVEFSIKRFQRLRVTKVANNLVMRLDRDRKGTLQMANLKR
jgi:hypothetical protein